MKATSILQIKWTIRFPNYSYKNYIFINNIRKFIHFHLAFFFQSYSMSVFLISFSQRSSFLSHQIKHHDSIIFVFVLIDLGV